MERIEKIAASTEQTNAIVLVADIRQAVGNRWNPSCEYAAQRVRDVIGKKVTDLTPAQLEQLKLLRPAQ